MRDQSLATAARCYISNRTC